MNYSVCDMNMTDDELKQNLEDLYPGTIIRSATIGEYYIKVVRDGSETYFIKDGGSVICLNGSGALNFQNGNVNNTKFSALFRDIILDKLINNRPLESDQFGEKDREEWINLFKNNSKEEILEMLIDYKFPF